MDAESFVVYIKTDDIYKDITEDVETGFDTLNYELDKPQPKRKNKKVIGLMKDGFRFFGLRVKTYRYLIDDDSEDEKAKGAKRFVIKRKLKFENYKKQFNLIIK